MSDAEYNPSQEHTEMPLFSETEIAWNDLAIRTVKTKREHYFQCRRSGKLALLNATIYEFLDRGLPSMERFTISLDEKLAHEFDHWIAERNYTNRSEAVRDLLRAELQSARLEKDAAINCVANLSYVFNHHERNLAERLNSLQHDRHDLTVSTMHAHLDHDHCLETVILRGNTDAVRQFAEAVIAERGVHHGKLNLVAADVYEIHAHTHQAVRTDDTDHTVYTVHHTHGASVSAPSNVAAGTRVQAGDDNDHDRDDLKQA